MYYLCKMVTYIYTLSHPLTGEVRYVGKTTNPKQRKSNHSNRARDKGTHKRNWINSLKVQGLKPLFEIIDEVHDDWKFWERYWIAQFKIWGFKLCNSALGGEGLEVGNQTTFKKGNVSWNQGKGAKRNCKICGEEFQICQSSKKATCSKECEKVYRKSRLHLNPTIFKAGQTVWNKGKFGYTTSRRGYAITEEERERLRSIALGNTSRRKKVKQYTMDMNLIREFDSIKQAKEVTGIYMQNCLTGRAKTAGGFIWQF